ncbi:MAG: hypothetical protein U1G05_10915 [Kiritimatiellia bacterium]
MVLAAAPENDDIRKVLAAIQIADFHARPQVRLQDAKTPRGFL